MSLSIFYVEIEVIDFLFTSIGLRKPYIWEYSRLNLQHTVLSKRKLTWFVDEGLVDGWDDPRFPTVRGVMRRGMTVEGLRQFIIAQGSSKANVTMEWDKIWAFNRKVIDPIATRCTAVVKEGAVEVTVTGFVGEEVKNIPNHPKVPDGEQKELWYSPDVYIDSDDAATFNEGETITFMNWGNAVIDQIVTNDVGTVTSVSAQLKPDDTNFKNTTKVTWLAKTDKAALTPVTCVYYEYIISKPVLSKEENFKDYINQSSKTVVDMYGEQYLKSLKKGDVIQLQRKGFFICDQPYVPPSIHSSVEAPCILIAIPDGHTKTLPTSGSKAKRLRDVHATNAPVSSSKKVKQELQIESSGAEQANIAGGGDNVELLKAKISKQGDKVRELKTSGAAKVVMWSCLCLNKYGLLFAFHFHMSP
jgi:bifunctional glutamyl/prolyl-tRNA synthetase